MIQSLLTGLLSWLLSFVLYSPRLTLFLGLDSGSTRRDDLLVQCLNPLTRDLGEPILGYRIIQPLIAHGLGWCGGRRDLLALLGSPGIAYLALILTLACCHWALHQRFSSAVALLGTFAIATTMVTQWTNTAWGHPDSLTLLPIALLLIWRNPLLVSIAVAIGVLNDERLVLALPFLALWWWKTSDTLLIAAKRLWRPALAVVAGLVFAMLIRAALAKGWIGPGIVDPYGGGSLLSGPFLRVLQPSTWPGLVVMVLLGYRWLWVVPAMAVAVLWRNGPDTRGALYLFGLLATTLATFTVADVSRSFAFLFPAILVGLEILRVQGGWTEERLSRWLAWILGLNVLTPAAKVFGVPAEPWKNPLSWASPYLPLPLNLWQWLRSPAGASSW